MKNSRVRNFFLGILMVGLMSLGSGWDKESNIEPRNNLCHGPCGGQTVYDKDGNCYAESTGEPCVEECCCNASSKPMGLDLNHDEILLVRSARDQLVQQFPATEQFLSSGNNYWADVVAAVVNRVGLQEPARELLVKVSERIIKQEGNPPIASGGVERR